MGDHFDISGVFETTEFEIAKSACKCKVGTSRISHMQCLMVVGFIVDEILRVGLKNDKVTGA